MYNILVVLCVCGLFDVDVLCVVFVEVVVGYLVLWVWFVVCDGVLLG